MGHFRWRHEKDSKVWKFWNWKIWSEHLNNIEKEIARLEKREKSLRDLINTTKETVTNLKDAKQWTHDASQRAKNHEQRIESLHSQLENAKQEHVEIAQANAVAERQAKEASDEKLRVFEAELAALRNEIAKQQTELDSLNSGTHDLHA